MILPQLINSSMFDVGYDTGLDAENLSSAFANNTGAVQPGHPRSLISVFVIRVFESTISKLATSEISLF